MKWLIRVLVAFLIFIVVGGYFVNDYQTGCNSQVKVMASSYLQEKDNSCGKNHSITNASDKTIVLYSTPKPYEQSSDEDYVKIASLEPGQSYNVYDDGYVSYRYSQDGSKEHWVYHNNQR